MPIIPPERLFLIILLVIWELAWKGIALWQTARNNQRNWFIAILVINSAGILPLAYIYFFRKAYKK